MICIQSRPNSIEPNSDTKDIWTKVRQLTKRRTDTSAVSGLTATSLNNHYTRVSTDDNHTPSRKQTVAPSDNQRLSEFDVFYQLDHLHHT